MTIHRKLTQILIGGLLISAGALLLSCSKEPTVTEKEYEDPEVRQEDGKTIISDAETESGEIILGATDPTPEGFPKDLPVMPGCELNNVFKSDKNMMIATFFSSQEIEEARKFYFQNNPFIREGWEIENAHEVAKGYTMTLSKGNRKAIVSLTLSKDPVGTKISYAAQAE